MEVRLQVDNNKVAGFSAGSINAITKCCQEYMEGIIEEAKRIEQSDRIGGTPVEVIASHVDEAKKNYRRNPAKKTAYIIINVIVDVLFLVIGAMFDKELLTKNNAYLIFYIIIIAITVVLLVLKYSKGV